MGRDKTAVIAKGMFDGDTLYQLRARDALPILVRQAFAQEPIYYSQLANELDMPMARNLNFVLGSVGTTIERLGRKWRQKIPPIQSLVLNQTSGLPGRGFYAGFAKLESPTRRQREAVLKRYFAQIYSYSRWSKVLAELGLQAAEPKAVTVVERARQLQGGGEGELHRMLKDRIFNEPSLVGAPKNPTVREREFPLPSGDRIDAYFERARLQFAVEVKASTSGVEDIARGMFQCVKYEAVLHKWRAWQSVEADIRVVLALGGPMPAALQSLRNALQVTIVDQLEGR